MNREHAGYYQFRRRLVLGYAALVILLLGLFGWKMSDAYRAQRVAAVMVATNSARAMAAHISELIDGIDEPILASVKAISALDGRALSSETVRPLLPTSTRAPDSRFWLLFVDAAGRGVVASNGLQVRGVSFADRAYFAIPAHAQSDALFVGEPTIGRLSKRRVFFVSRRVTSDSGEFLGVVAAAVDAGRVADVFELARLGPEMSITLGTFDGKVIARAPLFEESFTQDFSDILRGALERADATKPAAGSFEAFSPIQGDKRIFAYQTVRQYRLVVAVGLASAAWSEMYRQDVIAGLGALAVVLIVAFFSGKLALLRFWQLEETEEQQRTLVGVMNIVQKRLSEFSRTDALTGLPNRTELYDRLRDGLARCRRTNATIACLYLDIDRFKEVNDSLGHYAGDDTLKEFGRRLACSVRETDFVARLAGDEFVILLESLEHPGEAERVAAKVVAAMETDFELAGGKRRVTTSIGIVVADSFIDTPDSLLSKADAALYEAKHKGRNRFFTHREPDSDYF